MQIMTFEMKIIDLENIKYISTIIEKRKHIGRVPYEYIYH
jgi:hypothetical protein